MLNTLTNDLFSSHNIISNGKINVNVVLSKVDVLLTESRCGAPLFGSDIVDCVSSVMEHARAQRSCPSKVIAMYPYTSYHGNQICSVVRLLEMFV